MITGIKIKGENQHPIGLTDRRPGRFAEICGDDRNSSLQRNSWMSLSVLLSTVTPALTDVKRARFRQPDGPVPTCALVRSPPDVTRRRYSYDLHQDVTSRHVTSHAFLMFFYTLYLFFFFPPYPLFPRSRATQPLRSWGITECKRYMAREREPENGFPKRAGRDEAEARRFPSRCLLPYSEAPSTPIPKLLVYPRRRARPA